jgi:hypothetical protein
MIPADWYTLDSNEAVCMLMNICQAHNVPFDKVRFPVVHDYDDKVIYTLEVLKDNGWQIHEVEIFKNV